MDNRRRCFNTTGVCDSQLHYMVDIRDKLEKIKQLVDSGAYFTINRARQYGKTTTIQALTVYLEKDYVVIPLDFQKIGNEEFAEATIFSKAFVRYLFRKIRNRKFPIKGLNEDVLNRMESSSKADDLFSLSKLFEHLNDMCDTAEKPVVLIIDEVDSATNNQVFLDFLAQLRSGYLERKTVSTFHPCRCLRCEKY